MGHTVPANFNELVYLQREPIGVVALIAPWNVPLGMVVEKLAPALTVGNTCIIKPPSIDALEALKFAELLDTLGLPPGTINLITGPGGPVGGALLLTAAWTWWLLPAAAKSARKSWQLPVKP